MSWSFSLYLYLSLPLYFSLSTVCPSLVAGGSNDVSRINHVCLCVCLFTFICPCICHCLCLWFVHPWSLVETIVCLESIMFVSVFVFLLVFALVFVIVFVYGLSIPGGGSNGVSRINYRPDVSLKLACY